MKTKPYNEIQFIIHSGLKLILIPHYNKTKKTITYEKNAKKNDGEPTCKN